MHLDVILLGARLVSSVCFSLLMWLDVMILGARLASSVCFSLLMWLDVMILDVSLVVPAFVSLAPPRKLVAGLLVFRFAQLCSFGFKCPPVSWSS